MSPTKKPSQVDGLRRGVGTVPQVRPDDSIGRQENIGQLVRDEPTARVTLNLPASLLRQVDQWALDADGTLMLPRVSRQDAIRAMLRACTTDSEASSAALVLVRLDRKAI